MNTFTYDGNPVNPIHDAIDQMIWVAENDLYRTVDRINALDAVAPLINSANTQQKARIVDWTCYFMYEHDYVANENAAHLIVKAAAVLAKIGEQQ
jgi:hypothetical protein